LIGSVVRINDWFSTAVRAFAGSGFEMMKPRDSFLQIPLHGGHPCLSASRYFSYTSAASTAAPAFLIRVDLFHQDRNRPGVASNHRGGLQQLQLQVLGAHAGQFGILQVVAERVERTTVIGCSFDSAAGLKLL